MGVDATAAADGGGRVRRSVRRWWDASEPVRRLVAYLPQVDARRAALAGSLVVVLAILPVVFGVLTGLLVGAVPRAVRDGPGSSGATRLLVLTAASAAIFALMRLLEPVRSMAVWELAWRVDNDLQRRVTTATTAPVGIAHLEDPKSLDRVAVARGLDGMLGPGQALDALANITSRYVMTIASTAIVVSYRWWLGLGSLLAFVLVAGRTRREFLGIAQVIYGQAGTLRRADYVRDLALTPEAAKEARVFGLGGWLGDRYRTTWLEAMAEVWRSRRRTMVVFAAFVGVITVVRFGAVLYVGLEGVSGEITLATALVVLNALNGVSAANQITDDELKLAKGAAPVPAILTLERDAASDLAVRDTGTATARGLPTRSIRFEDVHFAYPDGAVVFAGLDLEIEAGRSLGVVGVNGAGKTTLVKLLARMYDPTAGRVLVDGLDLRELDARSWQRRVAAIFQDFVRYELTARDNIGLGAPELSDDDDALARAAARAGATDIVAKLPNGWDTVLDRQYTDGADLSGGEWQRIALARALLAVEGGAGVLVLDEPTANLDVRAEAALYDRFLDLTAGLTSIVISHRFSTVRRADRIVVVEHGRVVEDGTHDDLVALGGRYAAMFGLQAARFHDGAPADVPAAGLQ